MMRTEYSDFLDRHSAWVVVNTHPHRERIAIDNLWRQDFVAYCPMILRRLRTPRQPKDVLRPLFPGYVFVRVSQRADQWRPILSTYGVRKLVRFGDTVSFLDHRFIDSLRAREMDGAIMKPDSPYAVGQEVRMAGGPFDGLVARILEIREKDRLVVLMDLLNQSVRATVTERQITRVL
jgi:transcriptional antiterminator RfaH